MGRQPQSPQRITVIGGVLLVAAMMLCCAVTLLGWVVGAWRVLG